MSGGSLNYLHRQTLGLDSVASTWALESAVEQLEAAHPGSRAAIDARLILEAIQGLNRGLERLTEVFHELDRAGSGDSTAEDVAAAVAAYQIGQPP